MRAPALLKQIAPPGTAREIGTGLVGGGFLYVFFGIIPSQLALEHSAPLGIAVSGAALLACFGGIPLMRVLDHRADLRKAGLLS